MTKLGISKFSRENSCSSVCTGCCENREESDDGENAAMLADSDGGLGIVNAEEETAEEFFIGSSLFSNIQPYSRRNSTICMWGHMYRVFLKE